MKLSMLRFHKIFSWHRYRCQNLMACNREFFVLLCLIQTCISKNERFEKDFHLNFEVLKNTFVYLTSTQWERCQIRLIFPKQMKNSGTFGNIPLNLMRSLPNFTASEDGGCLVKNTSNRLLYQWDLADFWQLILHGIYCLSTVHVSL